MSQSGRLKVPSTVQARRMATISECAVGSLRDVTSFQPSEMMVPLRTITAPNGPPLFARIFSSESATARCMNVGRCPPLLRLDVDRPKHLGPRLGVVGDELAEIGGRAGKQRAAELEQPRLELRILEHCVDLSVEPVDDPDRRCLRRTD